jgi:hypothetical protein
MASSPQANYTDRVTATLDDATVDFGVWRLLRGQSNGSLRQLISVF